MPDPLLSLRPPLSLALPWARGHGGADEHSARRAIEAASALGFRAVQLDAAAAGLRARELDRSARRDLASLLRRLELRFSGLDLWIPPDHFKDAVHADRAIAAVAQAGELAGELASLVGGSAIGASPGRVVCVSLPPELEAEAVRALGASALRHGVVLADHAWPSGYVADEGPIGQGIDPGLMLARGADPIAGVRSMKSPPSAARLSDWSGVGRGVPGAPGGQLRVDDYGVALSVIGFRGCVVVDTRGLGSPERAAGDAARAWNA